MSDTSQRFQVRYWGVRASIPTPGPETVRYGGNTTCIEVRCDDEIIIIDTGTGARSLGNHLVAERNGRPLHARIIFSHLHMDHIQGFPFFTPIYSPKTTLDIYSPRPKHTTPKEFLAWQMAFPWFPVDLKKLESTLNFQDIVPGTAFDLGPARIETCPINHPGGAMAIRVNHGGRSFVQCSDIEHVGEEPDSDLVEFIRGADYLSYDSTYLPGDEYERHKGWGHSTWRHGLATAKAGDVDTFIAFHHDPAHDDDFMDEVAADLEAAAPGSLVAREGMTLDLLDGTVTMSR